MEQEQLEQVANLLLLYMSLEGLSGDLVSLQETPGKFLHLEEDLSWNPAICKALSYLFIYLFNFIVIIWQEGSIRPFVSSQGLAKLILSPTGRFLLQSSSEKTGDVSSVLWQTPQGTEGAGTQKLSLSTFPAAKTPKEKGDRAINPISPGFGSEAGPGCWYTC